MACSSMIPYTSNNNNNNNDNNNNIQENSIGISRYRNPGIRIGSELKKSGWVHLLFVECVWWVAGAPSQDD